jgi:hypothetical protein
MMKADQLNEETMMVVEEKEPSHQEKEKALVNIN